MSLVSTTLLLRSLSHTWLGESRLLLFWVVNRSHPLYCSAFLGVQYSALYTQPLSDIIEKHSVLRHMFTDDTKFYNSTPRSSTDSLFCCMQNLVSDVKKWTIHNKLQLNEGKTEALLFDPSTSSDIPDVLEVGQSGTPFCNSARYLGVNVCQWAHHEATGWQNLPDWVLWDAEDRIDFPVSYHRGNNNTCRISCTVSFWSTAISC